MDPNPYVPQRQGGYAPPQQGGYNPPQQGGYNPPPQPYPSPAQGRAYGQQGRMQQPQVPPAPMQSAAPQAAVPQSGMPPQNGPGGASQTGYVPGGYRPRPRAALDPEALAAAFSYDGYQVVRREYNSYRYEPTLTIKDKSIVFNNSCIRKMDDVVYIHMMVNPDQEKLVVKPCTAGEKDSIRWCVARGDTRKSREISCERFTGKLFRLMGWENLYRYKLQGTQITYQGEQIYVFDLMNVEPVTPQTIGADGKRRRGQVVEPEEWQTSFGLGVEEHAASTQVDLSQGFEEMSPTGAPAEQVAMEEVMKV